MGRINNQILGVKGLSNLKILFGIKLVKRNIEALCVPFDLKKVEDTEQPTYPSVIPIQQHNAAARQTLLHLQEEPGSVRMTQLGSLWVHWMT